MMGSGCEMEGGFSLTWPDSPETYISLEEVTSEQGSEGRIGAH